MIDQDGDGDGDGDDDEGLGDYETGFVDAVFFLQGIEHPTAEQFGEALRILERFFEEREQRAGSGKPS